MFEGGQVMSRVFSLAFGLMLGGMAMAKEFTDTSGHTLTVEKNSAGISFWVIEDGRSAETGPTMDKAGAQRLGAILRQAWANRNKAKWKSETFLSRDDRVTFYAENGNVMAIAGDSKHTAKSFTIADAATLNAILQGLGASGGQGSLGAPTTYPTHK